MTLVISRAVTIRCANLPSSLKGTSRIIQLYSRLRLGSRGLLVCKTPCDVSDQPKKKKKKRTNFSFASLLTSHAKVTCIPRHLRRANLHIPKGDDHSIVCISAFRIESSVDTLDVWTRARYPVLVIFGKTTRNHEVNVSR